MVGPSLAAYTSEIAHLLLVFLLKVLNITNCSSTMFVILLQHFLKAFQLVKWACSNCMKIMVSTYGI